MNEEKLIRFIFEALRDSWKLEDLEKIVKSFKGTYGVIHDSKSAEIHGVKGFLIWDFILYNEITFMAMDGKTISLYSSLSDTETKTKWNELANKFGASFHGSSGILFLTPEGGIYVPEETEKDTV